MSPSDYSRVTIIFIYFFVIRFIIDRDIVLNICIMVLKSKDNLRASENAVYSTDYNFWPLLSKLM